MLKEQLQKLALYSILPCVLAGFAIFLNGLFQHQFTWQLKLLDIQGESFRIEPLGTYTTTLFGKPYLSVYSKEGWLCGSTTEVVYVQNKSLQDRATLEKWFDARTGFTFIILLLVILHAAGDGFYLLKQTIGWGKALTAILLVAIGAIAIISLLGPIRPGPQFGCWARAKVQAELTNISSDGMIYPDVGAILSIAAVLLVGIGYIPKKQPS